MGEAGLCTFVVICWICEIVNMHSTCVFTSCLCICEYIHVRVCACTRACTIVLPYVSIDVIHTSITSACACSCSYWGTVYVCICMCACGYMCMPTNKYALPSIKVYFMFMFISAYYDMPYTWVSHVHMNLWHDRSNISYSCCRFGTDSKMPDMSSVEIEFPFMFLRSLRVQLHIVCVRTRWWRK